MNPYLSFNGNCKEAFDFYTTRLGATVSMMMTLAESPMADQVPPEHRQRIMHARLQFGADTLMGSDTMPGQPFNGLHGFSLSLNPTDPAEAERLFAALSEGGQVTMPLAQTFWARQFGMVTDRFGVPWMVNCE